MYGEAEELLASSSREGRDAGAVAQKPLDRLRKKIRGGAPLFHPEGMLF